MSEGRRTRHCCKEGAFQLQNVIIGHQGHKGTKEGNRKQTKEDKKNETQEKRKNVCVRFWVSGSFTQNKT